MNKPQYSGLREEKLVFREPSVAGAIARVLLENEQIMGYPVTDRQTTVYEDEYLALSRDTAETAAPRCVTRRRRENGGAWIVQQKERRRGKGNDWAYDVATRTVGFGKDMKALIRVQVKRDCINLSTPSGPVGISLDRCVYVAPGGEKLGMGIEVEVKGAGECSAMPPLVDYLRGAYGLLPARRSKLERGLALLGHQAEPPRKVILDMDPGVDDAIAILLALASPELEVLAITTVAGNVDLENTTRNTRLVVDKACLFYPGVKAPLIAKGLIPAGELPDASDVHGPDGLGGYASRCKGDPKTPLCNESAPEIIARLLHDNPGEITLIATGPLTNIAACAERYPLALAQARELIAMGGVFFQEGNRSAAAEFNVHRDPPSAAKVLEFARRRRAPGGPVNLPLTFVGLDVTHRVRLLRDDIQGKNKKAAFLRAISDTYMKFYNENEGLNGCYLHDPLAVALAIHPALCEVEPFCVEIETRGEHTAGATIADSRPTRIFGNYDKRVTRVCVSVNADRARQLILDRILPPLRKK